MPKRLIKKYMPDHRTIRDHRHLKVFGKLLHNGNLWHFNRRSVSGAFAVGVFCAFIPLPSQMLIAAALAILVQVNLPISVSLVWITNPVTMPPIFYGSYKLGAFMLGQEALTSDYEISAEWLMLQIDCIWQPLILGCFIAGVICALLAYIGIRLLWRLHIVQHIKERRARRKKIKSSPVQ